MTPPTWEVPSTPRSWPAEPPDRLLDLDWSGVPPLPPFLLADGSRPAEQQTELRLHADGTWLHARFDCADRDIWATYTERDDPIYDEEVVEVFLAGGTADPTRYVELEVSPDGVLFDALIDNPTSRFADIVGHRDWDCPGLRWQARRDDAGGRWSAAFAVPWREVPGLAGGRQVRANFYRIERPREERPEFSCWSPTMTTPPNFHVPSQFGLLTLPTAPTS